MRWTIQRRLTGLVALTAVTLTLMAVVDLISVARVTGHLRSLESDYLPLLELESRTEATFVSLVRAFQEAVAAQDEARLRTATNRKDELLSMLDDAPPLVDPAGLQRARRLTEAWFRVATDVSRRLMVNETGEELVRDIEQMQALQKDAQDALRSALTVDRVRLGRAFTEARRAESLSVWVRMLTRVVLLVAMSLVGFTLGRHLVRRVAALESGFERFGRGDFDEPVPVRGDDELSEMTVHANQMAARLKHLTTQLEHRQAELERTNGELEAFSYSVSHDLRAPLRSIDGFSKALLEDYADTLNAEAKGYLDRVRAAAQRMATLIDDMLQLSRIGRTDMQRIEVDLSELARSVAEELGREHAAREVRLSVEEGLIARGDPRLLRIVLENLLGNAYKFTGRTQNPLVEVGAEDTPEGRAFYVRDNGAGFDQSYVGKLFTPFQRLHVEKDFPGTGVGLATVQRIVHRHGGRVWASGKVGEGATFYFLLDGQP